MEDKDIAEKLKVVMQYFQDRKEALFNRIQILSGQLDIVLSDISENETYLELEINKEQQESNIFNLYNTTEEYSKKKEFISEHLNLLKQNKKTMEEELASIQQELETVKTNFVFIQILVNYFEDKVVNHEEEVQQEKQKKLDITNQLKLCLGILDLDKERCAMELQKLIDQMGS